MRRFIRHPTDYPLDYHHADRPLRRRTLKDIGGGGLCFEAEEELPPGTPLHICIPLPRAPFEADGVVAWCRRDDDHFAVGVRFNDEHVEFGLRMVEQICHIEHYRREVWHHQRRALSHEEAAAEWIDRFAADFPRLHGHA